jgi:hypothetical protein
MIALRWVRTIDEVPDLSSAGAVETEVSTA